MGVVKKYQYDIALNNMDMSLKCPNHISDIDKESDTVIRSTPVNE